MSNAKARANFHPPLRVERRRFRRDVVTAGS
jgi:hypothetical protein